MAESQGQNGILQSGPFLIERPLLSALEVFCLFQLILEALRSFLSDLLSGISAEKQQFLIVSFSILYREPLLKGGLTLFFFFFEVK